MSSTDDPPDPVITDVSVPDSVSPSESINITVEGTNNGGTGGHFSTITISSPDLDESDDSSQLQVTDASDHAYHETAVRGDTVYDADGEEMTAEYALAEAGSDGQSFWDGGESRQLSVEFTPESTGTIKDVTGDDPEIIDKRDRRGMLDRFIDDEMDRSSSPFQRDFKRFLRHYHDQEDGPNDGEKQAVYDELNRSDDQTLGGETVDSPSEKRIADFLFSKGVSYDYRQPQEHPSLVKPHTSVV